jgi:IS5 family transposase
MCVMLDLLLEKTAPVRLLDSSMLHVCKLVRSSRHHVAKGIAAFGKNWQGWHFGFKLHVAVSPQGRLCAVHFTPANEHDAQQIPYLVNDETVVAVGDTTYGASVMRRKMWQKHRVYILAPPHPKQTKKLLADWQRLLLRKRAKIECTFDFLKEHLLLETSFPRSVNGYAVHHVRVLLSYQLGWGF